MIKKYTSGAFFTNTYLVIEGQKCVIVDPGLGFDSYAQEIKSSYEIMAILITHGHMDHIDSIGLFSCPIYINKDEEKFLVDDTLSLYKIYGKKRTFDVNSLDIHYFNDGGIINIGDMSFKVITTPGHTKGSSCFLYKNCLFSGDTLFQCSMGRTDFPTGSEKDMRASLRKIVNEVNDNVVVYPGHGEKTTIKFERQNNPYVINAIK